MAVHAVSWHGPKVICRFIGIRKWVLRKETFLILQENLLDFLLELDVPASRWVFSADWFDLAISVFREVSINTVFTQILISRWRRLYLKMVHGKNWRVTLLRSGTLSSTRFSLNSWSRSGISEPNGSLCSISWFPFSFGFGFLVGLGNGSLRSFRSTCSLWHRYWRRIHPTQIFPCSSLTVAWHSCGWWSRRTWGRRRMIILLFWKSHGCWTIRTGWRICWQAWIHDRNEVLCVALHHNTVFNEMLFFWPLILVHSYSFRATKTVGVSSRISMSRKCPILCCSSPLVVMTIVGLYDVVKVSIQQNSSYFEWSSASTLRSRQQILLLLV